MRGKLTRLNASSLKQSWWLILAFLILGVVIGYSIIYRNSQQFSLLADSFLHLKLSFLHPIGGLGADPVLYRHKIYWSEGPFPAIVLIPFVAVADGLGRFFYQGYLSWLLVLAVMFLVYKLARHFEYAARDSLLLALAFCLGSVFIGVSTISNSWYFAQVLSTLLLFLSLYVYFIPAKRRWWLLGLICGCLLLTRVPATAIFVFFLWELLISLPKATKKRLTVLLELCLPLLIAAVLLGLYNYLRFHNVLQSGFTYELLPKASTQSRTLGVFSVAHIPSNLYNLLLRPPQEVLRASSSWTLKFPFIRNDVYGMSIFITSPYLLYLFTRKWKDFTGLQKRLLVAAVMSLIGVLMYFGIGTKQYGYRYQLDFLPVLFVLFMLLYRKFNNRIGPGMKVLLLVSIALNFYLLVGYVF